MCQEKKHPVAAEREIVSEGEKARERGGTAEGRKRRRRRKKKVVCVWVPSGPMGGVFSAQGP